VVHPTAEIIHGLLPAFGIVAVVLNEAPHVLQHRPFAIAFVIQGKASFFWGNGLERPLRKRVDAHFEKVEDALLGDYNRNIGTEQLDVDDGIGASLHRWDSIFVDVVDVVH